MVTVNGRVRATVRLTAEGVDGACVVASSWSSARAFPRTLASGVAFEVETAEGEIYAVDPFEALLVIPVRRRAAADGARTEDGWIAHGDEIEVEGEVQRARGRRHPTLRAERLSMPAPEGNHRVPPRTLARGQAAPVEPPAPPPTPPVEKTSPVATTPPVEPPPEVTEAAPPPAPDESPATTEPAEPGQPPRRPKKKRPDSSGTPTPIQ